MNSLLEQGTKTSQSEGSIFIQTNNLNDPCSVTASFQLGLPTEVSDEAYARM